MLEYTKDELKKIFYKEDTIAFLRRVKKTGLYYSAVVENEKDQQDIFFLVPLDEKEMGDAVFLPEMSAKHLIRWMQ